VKLTAHFHLLRRLRMSTAVPVVSVYVFVPWTRTNVTFSLQDISAEDGRLQRTVPQHLYVILNALSLATKNYYNIYDHMYEIQLYRIFAEYNQQDAKFHNLFISVRRSTYFRKIFRPSSGAQNCKYSVKYLSDRY